MKARATVILVVLLVAAAGATSAVAGAQQVNQDDGTDENATAGPADDGEVGDDQTGATPEPDPGPATGPAQDDTGNETQAANETQAGNETNVTARVTMDNQLSDGRTVVVESVAMPEGGFITIHDERLQEGDAIGSAVGVSEYLEPGEHMYVEITLFNVSGAEFDGAANGTNVTVDTAQPDANETDQTAADPGNETAPGDGPSVGGTATDDAPTGVNETGEANATDDDVQAGDDPAAGDAPTADNETAVMHDGTQLTENQTLIAMPHRDTNDNREYDFVTSNGTEDGPYTENGTAVTDDAEVRIVDPGDVPMALPFEIERDGGQTVNETVEPYLEPPANETNQTAADPGNETAPGDGPSVGGTATDDAPTGVNETGSEANATDGDATGGATGGTAGAGTP